MRKSVVFFLVLFSVVAFFTPQASLSAQVILKKPLPLSQQNQASITAIIPRVISIQQGGPSAVVAVDGKFLETVLSVQAIRGGRVMGEIAVKLAQPWPASRKLELQAGANALVAPGYRLRAIGKVGLNEFKIDVPLTEFSLEVIRNQGNIQIKREAIPFQQTPPAVYNLPDLIITTASLEPLQDSNTQDQKDYYKLKITLKNIGRTSVSWKSGIMIINGEAEFDHSLISFYTPSGGLYLGPGEAWNGEIPVVYFTQGVREAKFTADPFLGRVTELNENNNLYILTIPTTAPSPTPLPDLAITSLTIQPPTGPPSARFTITVVVKNIGSGNMASCRDIEVLVHGVNVRYQYLNSLAAGESQTLTFTTDYSMPPGTKNVICTVDPGDHCKESNENNNKASKTFIVE
ncbi:MAG: hypothetical protein MUO31_10310 [Thermodesulfovibrionales bacterium]|nr:hypothetical protein [Thermodesulfovibrionales bacterium]